MSAGTKDWERTLLDIRGDEPAVLYRNKDTGTVDWIWAGLWVNVRNERPLELLKRTTAREAFNLKWLSREE